MFDSLPVETKVEVFEYLSLRELFSYCVLVSHSWRSIIGEFFVNEQFNCTWREVWERSIEFLPLVEYKLPSGYPIYDPFHDVCYLVKKTSQKSMYYLGKVHIPTISDVNYPGASMITKHLEISSRENVSFPLQYSMSKQLVTKGGDVLLLDTHGFIHHLEPQDSVLSCSQDSYSGGQLTERYACTVFQKEGKDYIFICGGLTSDSVSDTWKLYCVASKSFVSAGELLHGRFYHSCCYIEEEESSYLFINGGRHDKNVFTNSPSSSAEILSVDTLDVEDIELLGRRNLHWSFSLPGGKALIIGGMRPGELFDIQSRSSSHLEGIGNQVTLPWNSWTAEAGEGLIFEQENSRLLETLHYPYHKPPILMSQCLSKTLTKGNLFTYGDENNLVVVTYDKGYASVWAIPNSKLRVGIPIVEDILTLKHEKDVEALVYLLDSKYNVQKSIRASIPSAQEFQTSFRALLSEYGPTYIQVHFKNSISYQTKILISQLILHASPLEVFIGLEIY